MDINDEVFILSNDDGPIGHPYDELWEAKREGARIAGFASQDGIPGPWMQEADDEWVMYYGHDDELRIYAR